MGKQYSGGLDSNNIYDVSLNSFYDPFESTTNRFGLRKNSNSPSIAGNFGFDNLTNRFQSNRMMKVIKGGTRNSGGGFFSKMMGNNDKINNLRIVGNFAGKNNDNFKQKLFESEMKMIENELFNDNMSEMP